MKPGTSTSFDALKQVDAGRLNVGYAEAGPAGGPAVILLHGWPYDIHSFADVTSALASAGYRVIVPFVCGYGTTRFLSGDTPRNGQQAALAADVTALMDALGIDRAIFAGFDWGARSANVIAALWPDRCQGLVSVSGYLIGSQAANAAPVPPQAEHTWWYQFYFATERGRAGYDAYRREFSRFIWQLASPRWAFDDATFARSATAFDNPDHVAIVIHNYRWRIGLAEGEPHYDALERRLAGLPAIAAPRSRRLRRQILGQVRAPDHLWWRRAQPAPGSPAGLRSGDRRRRWLLTGEDHAASARARSPDVLPVLHRPPNQGASHV